MDKHAVALFATFHCFGLRTPNNLLDFPLFKTWNPKLPLPWRPACSSMLRKFYSDAIFCVPFLSKRGSKLPFYTTTYSSLQEADKRQLMHCPILIQTRQLYGAAFSTAAPFRKLSVKSVNNKVNNAPPEATSITLRTMLLSTLPQWPRPLKEKKNEEKNNNLAIEAMCRCCACAN